MNIIRTSIHPDVENFGEKRILKRIATRAIILRGDKILLLYTKRYDDYSLPGGGVDEGENITQGLIRELSEETGATGVRNIKPIGIYEEYRPWFKPEHDVLHMLSYCYTCEIDDVLGQTKYEPYELANGMKPVWINIKTAIEHNEKVMLNQKKESLSIERETFLLKLIMKKIK